MNKPHSQRFAIIGLPGSGKSTFASKLGAILNLPVHHLDRHRFEPGGEKRDKQEFIEIQKAMLSEEAWVVEGCSFSTFEMRFTRADTVIYFQFPRLLCIWRICKRLFTDKDLFDTGCAKTVDWRLLQYIWNFEKEKGTRIEALRNKYPHIDFRIFKSSKDADKYIKTLRAI